MHEQCIADVALGRMQAPRPADKVNLSEIRVARRFGVDQGLRANGQRKIRAVDDETKAGVNPCTTVREKLSTEGVDLFFLLMQMFSELTGLVPDVESRRGLGV